MLVREKLAVLALISGLFVLATSAPALAQQEAPAAPDGKALLQEAHAISQKAESLDQYTQIIELCEKATAQPLSESLMQYAHNLQAWAHNQRGESYASQAAGLSRAGSAEAAAKMESQSFQEFEQAIVLNPDYWKAIHNRGVNLALAGDFDAAINDFTRVVQLKPEYANGWFNRGEIYYEQGKYQEAIADYGRALAINKQDIDTFMRRGHAYFQLGQFQPAIDDYNQAVQIDDKNLEAILNRADANRSLGRWQFAADDYRRAITLDSKSGRAYQGAAWLLATCPDASIRKADLALSAARQALELLGQKDTKALDAMAAALANNGQFDEAVEMQKKAIETATEEAAPALRQRLETYQKQQPYRDKP